MLEPTTMDETRQAVLACPGLIAVGGGTKPALSAVPKHYQRLQLGKLSGVLEYEPSEFTITVLAGTSLTDIQAALDEHGQYLPFDPPLARAGATIGGTVAAGLSGPGAHRYGPIRDFLIGVRYLDGEGRLISGGGKVVKNAAGFDLPKFLIGSLGRFGVLVELTFKVFPRTETALTFGLGPRSFQHAREMLTELSRGPCDLDALDFAPGENIVWVRIAGREDAVEARVRQIGEEVFPDCGIAICEPAEAAYLWRQLADFSWASSERYLVKVPIGLGQLQAVEAFCKRSQVPRNYSLGGNVAWIAPATLDDFDLDGLVLRVPAGGEPLLNPLIGSASRNGFEIQRALKLAFDPGGRFPDLSPPPSAGLKSAGPDARPRRGLA